jgi:hypothetical protein
MKKLIACSSAVGLAALLTGCVLPMGSVGGVNGLVYTDVEGAGGATGNTGSSKKGVATSEGIICVATGDSSIQAACANGGITKIHHVDYHVMSVLGVYVKATTTVYGE